jgi:hypothetical protein
MEVGHDDGNLRSITGCAQRPARAVCAQEFSQQALLAESRSERLTPLPYHPQSAARPAQPV